jgi:hypothetical protein
MKTMLTLRRIQKLQDQRSVVRLEDGRVGKIVRVDTTFPANETEVSVYTEGARGPGIAKVSLSMLTAVSAAS